MGLENRTYKDDEILTELHNILQEHREDPMRGRTIQSIEIKEELEERVGRNLSQHLLTSTLKYHGFEKYSNSKQTQRWMVNSGEIEYDT